MKKKSYLSEIYISSYLPQRFKNKIDNNQFCNVSHVEEKSKDEFDLTSPIEVKKSSSPVKKLEHQIDIYFITDLYSKKWVSDFKKLEGSDDNYKITFPQLVGFFKSENVLLVEKIIQTFNIAPIRWKIGAIEEEIEEALLKSNLSTLINDIYVHNPKLILTMGAKSFNILMKKDERLSDIHGQIFQFNKDELLPQLMPIFHPHLLAINPSMKRATWEDLQKAMAYLSDSLG